MRLKKGSKVEVLNTRDSPYGSWWSAVIMSGNGHYYQVIYDVHPDHLNDTIIERIPRKNLRPCPPPHCPKNWSQGDFVEVFHCGSWKYCMVEDVAGCDYYFVQLHDSSEKFKAHNSSFRLPRIWKDSKWVSMQKNDCFKLTDTKLKKKLRNHMLNHGKKGLHCIPADEPLLIAPRGGSRGSTFNEKGRYHFAATEYSSTLPEKVDDFASLRKILGEINVHTSFKRTKYPDIYKEDKRTNDLKDDSCSVCSSVGSNNPIMSSHPTLSEPRLDFKNTNYVAGSFGGLKTRKRTTLLQKVDVDVEIHKIELNAYRSTLVALHASGPFSWEQESMITDLRSSLNISDDEHRQELKHLASLS